MGYYFPTCIKPCSLAEILKAPFMHRILYLLLLLSLTACGQIKTNRINNEIKSTKTNKHINIPGTRLYIIPPPNFKVASTFLGLQKGETSMFNIYDLVGGNINTNAATFSKAEFESKGAKVFDFKEIKVNGFTAKYIHMQGDATAKAYSIVFGDTTFTTMVMTVYPVTDEKTGNEIINSLNTIYYDKNKKIDPFETAKFSLDDKTLKFKFFQYSSNMYIYSIGGIENKDDRDAPIVLITQFPKDNTMTAKSIAETMVNKAQQYGLTNPELKNTTTEKINGYETYQTEVYGQMKGKNSILYYCVLAKGDKAIVIQGISKKDIQTNIEEFKKMANKVKIN
jgi:hypothetical protein